MTTMPNLGTASSQEAPPMTSNGKPLKVFVVAVSTRALFDMEEDNTVFDEQGLEAFHARQRAMENTPFQPGPAFPLVSALLRLNKKAGQRVVRVVILSGQHPDTGLRVMKSAEAHGLDINYGVFTGGAATVAYLGAMETDLFLTRNMDDAQAAIDIGVASACVSGAYSPCLDDGPIRIAFDGDAVLFSDESEAIAQSRGIEAFYENESQNALVPMQHGPMANVLMSLQTIRSLVPDGLRIALITARSGWSQENPAPHGGARERALRTLREWGVGVDEAMFLGPMSKGGFVAAFRPHIFFDDSERHIRHAEAHAPAGHVPYRTTGHMAAVIKERTAIVVTGAKSRRARKAAPAAQPSGQSA